MKKIPPKTFCNFPISKNLNFSTSQNFYNHLRKRKLNTEYLIYSTIRKHCIFGSS